MVWQFCEKSVGHICEGFFLDSQFYSMGLGMYLCTSTTQSWLLLLCNEFEIRKGEPNYFILFQEYFDYSWFLEIPQEFQDQLINLYKHISWDSDRDCIDSIDQFGEYWYFNNVNSANQ